MILETERLVLREMDQGDLDDLKAILQNPRVMYAYQHEFSDKDVLEWLQRQRRRYQEDGFGLWAVVLKSTGRMIGQAGLTMQPYRDRQVLEIGYLLRQDCWHKGYATEAALGCKAYAFEKLNQTKVYSIIKADNQASIKVARRIGMEKEDEFMARYYNGEMLHDLYSVSRTSSVERMTE